MRSANVIERHVVPAGDREERLDAYLLGLFDIFPSRNAVKKAMKAGEIRVDGGEGEPQSRVRPGQVIELLEPEEDPFPAYDLPLRVHYVDDWLAVVEKPPGLRINGNEPKTLEHALPSNLTKSPMKDALRRPRPAHRLDASTGGLVLVARTARALVELGRIFETREVSKRYRAVVVGRMEGNGVIEGLVDGRDSRTLYACGEQVPSLKCGTLTVVDAWPETGRRHQVRRHLAGRGFPILGDRTYGEGSALRSKGIFLWAAEISFRHPFLGWVLTVRAEEPPKFRTFLERERRRQERYT